ncbi:hypothetical protein MMC32_003905 [Xylographa parallela]|nr:hypothetical protein [Xylographa parallela]
MLDAKKARPSRYMGGIERSTEHILTHPKYFNQPLLSLHSQDPHTSARTPPARPSPFSTPPHTRLIRRRSSPAGAATTRSWFPRGLQDGLDGRPAVGDTLGGLQGGLARRRRVRRRGAGEGLVREDVSMMRRVESEPEQRYGARRVSGGSGLDIEACFFLRMPGPRR